MAELQTLLEIHGAVSPEPRVHYIQHEFIVPAGASRVQVRLRFRKERLCQLFLSLFDPNAFRGCHMQPGAHGDVDLVLWVAADDAGRGGIPGALPAGI
ncbi:PHP-like protein, partial [Candidatus Gracilibacteria bacterium]|nr:PHP-like protein [Candidatus Gracilibacteria bacterium]